MHRDRSKSLERRDVCIPFLIRRCLISLGLCRSLNIMVGTCPCISLQSDSILMIILAGRDTTASTLTFIVYLLAMHPRVLTRLRQEVLDKVGPTGIPNQNDIRDMRYLRAVIDGTYSCTENLNTAHESLNKRDAEALSNSVCKYSISNFT